MRIEVGSSAKLNAHTFIEIKEGVSCFGSDNQDPYASDKEKPIREVFVSTFSISKYATTFSQYANFLKSNQIPLFIKLADLEYKPGCFASYLKNVYALISHIVDGAIENGELTLFLDGLDEVPVNYHEILQREIERIATKHNQVFISCWNSP